MFDLSWFYQCESLSFARLSTIWDWAKYPGEYWDGEFYVMQYTWIKDKNWKEIYDWDIISWTTFSWKPVTERVVYFETGFYMVPIDTDIENRWQVFARVSPLYTSKHMLVVDGNIYENPELLRQ